MWSAVTLNKLQAGFQQALTCKFTFTEYLDPHPPVPLYQSPLHRSRDLKYPWLFPSPALTGQGRRVLIGHTAQLECLLYVALRGTFGD